MAIVKEKRLTTISVSEYCPYHNTYKCINDGKHLLRIPRSEDGNNFILVCDQHLDTYLDHGWKYADPKLFQLEHQLMILCDR